MIAGVPSGEVTVPAGVRAVAGGRALRAVWRNELGGITFEIPTAAGRWFVKWAPAECGLDLAAEAARLRWAARFTPVPVVDDHGRDADGEWLVTVGLPGDNAVTDRWRAAPATAVTAIGAGLRHLHDALPVDACPFSWGIDDRMAELGRRAAAGRLDPSRWHAEHTALGRAGALARLADAPPVDRPVVCHGDACAPNTLIGADGTWTGHVDLGALGVADRWADLAIATWSLNWNYGPGWEPTLLAAYGVDPDPVRTVFYRLLWDLTS
ncbi:MAG: kanamycin kinase [Micromonosporaceae bacterium]|jgi:kanamycin kinase|nr:kanamycin kinase [Micromonosporaceae bacterium]